MKTMMQAFFSMVLVAGMSLTVCAQNDTEGMKYYKCGLPEYAKVALLKELNGEEGNKAEVCYYLGNLYSDMNKPDSASFYFKKGMETDALYVLNFVGEGQLMLKKNPAAAENMFSEALSGKNKKNPAVLLAVAKAYSGNNPGKMSEYLEKAKEVDSKYADIYVFEGDILMTSGKIGDACSRYEQAIYFDPACVEAYVKFARIYAKTSPQVGLEMLQKLEAREPASIIPPYEMADIYYVNSKYGDAAKAYEKFISSGYVTTRELTRYATVLFYYNDFIRSFELAQKVLKREPDNVVMKRISMYNLYELKEYAKGLEAAEAFFKSTRQEDLIGQDYLFYGRLLLASNKLDQAIPQLEKVLSIDSTRVDVYKELGGAYEKMGNYDKAVPNYELFLKKGGEQIKIVDYFMLGKCHYFAGNALDTLPDLQDKRTAHFAVADSIFGYVAEKVPDNYLGSFWRARANSSLDPETEQGLAKPYYEAAASILEKDNKNVRLLIECYSYLGYYHYLKNQPTESKVYWNKILALDPENDVAKKALEGIK